jgi:hypothetical protein
VIHLGDLTARGGSEKHGQQFDDALVFRVICLESGETFTVVDPLIILKIR